MDRTSDWLDISGAGDESALYSTVTIQRYGLDRGLQYGALPWRNGTGGLEIMPVSSRDTKRWIIPKGWPMAARSGSAAAAIEAMEEAGLLGEISDQPIGHFHYGKRLARRVDLCRVEVFSLRVARQRSHWPEKHERMTEWFSVAAAIAPTRKLADLIASFARNRA